MSFLKLLKFVSLLTFFLSEKYGKLPFVYFLNNQYLFFIS